MNNNDSGKLSIWEKMSYGFGDLASVLYWQTFMLYFTYFYTDVFLIPAAAAATMFLVSRIWDGINDPIMGMIADRTETKWGKFRPYLLWLCVPFAFMGVLTFTVPDFDETGKLIWAYATFIGIMMLYTAINIPYTALLGVISPDSKERTTLSSVKFIFAYSAGTIVAFTLLPMSKALGDGNDAAGWQMSFVIYGIAAVIFFLITFRFTRERVKPPIAQKSNIEKDILELVRNAPWFILLAITITFILFVAVRGSVTVHYFKYFVGSHELDLPFLNKGVYDFNWLASFYNGIGQISSLLGVFIVNWFAKVVGKKNAFVVFFIIAIVSTGAIYWLDSNQLGLLFFLQITGSATGGPLSVLIWAMYADTADYAEWKKGRRTTGLIFSASTMSQKIGWAMGAYVALTLMAQVGFVANVEQTAESVDGLIMLFSIIPAGMGILAVLISYFYPLNDKKVEEIVADLKKRTEDDKQAIIFENQTNEQVMSPADALFSFTGRITRAKFWIYTILINAISLIGFFMDKYISGSMGIFYGLSILILLWPILALNIKRCHDLGKSGLFTLVALVPILNLWYIIEIGFLKGMNKDNPYGSDPLAKLS